MLYDIENTRVGFFFLFGEGVGAREFKSIFKFVYEMPKWQKACWNTSEPKCQSCVHSSGSCFGMKGKGRNSRAPWIKLQHTSMVGTSNDCPRIIDHGSLLSAFIIGKEPTLGSWSQKKRGGNRHEDMTTFKSVHNATGSVHIKSFSKIVFNSRLF